MLGLLGKKLGQTRVYDAKGNIVHVTVVLAGPNRVIQCKTVEKDGYRAVQLGFDEQKESRVGRPLNGHFKRHNAAAVKRIREFRDFTLEVKPGDVVSVGIFAQGDYVDAIGTTKGRGFEGVMARHGFRGGDASHGAKGFRRRPAGCDIGAAPGVLHAPGAGLAWRSMPRNVLVVDPDAALADEIRRAFSPAGFSVTSLAAGEVTISNGQASFTGSRFHVRLSFGSSETRSFSSTGALLCEVVTMDLTQTASPNSYTGAGGGDSSTSASGSGRQTRTSRRPFSRRVSTSPLEIRRCRVRVDTPSVNAASSTESQSRLRARGLRSMPSERAASRSRRRSTSVGPTPQ